MVLRLNPLFSGDGLPLIGVMIIKFNELSRHCRLLVMMDYESDKRGVYVSSKVLWLREVFCSK